MTNRRISISGVSFFCPQESEVTPLGINASIDTISRKSRGHTMLRCPTKSFVKKAREQGMLSAQFAWYLVIGCMKLFRRVIEDLCLYTWSIYCVTSNCNIAGDVYTNMELESGKRPMIWLGIRCWSLLVFLMLCK